MTEPQYEAIKMDLWDALDYLAKHNLVADGPVVWLNGEPHLATKPATDIVLPSEAEVLKEIVVDGDEL